MITQPPSTSDHTNLTTHSASGYCLSCNAFHSLGMGPAYDACQELIHHFQRYETIDLQPRPDSLPQLSTTSLFGDARGKMFGALVGHTAHGETVMLRAFSGQFNGLWHVPGWAPPLFDLDDFNAINVPGERGIKMIGAQMDDLDESSNQWSTLRKTRRQMSRRLMQEIHALYRLNNFRGRAVSMTDAFVGNTGIPTGCGDCCGPKLLQQAALNAIQPIGIAEFFWGKANRSNSRHHGQFYVSCKEKCQPILGHMLCGLDDNGKETP